MQEGILQLLRDAGIAVRLEPRGYRATVSLPWVESTKLLKPQNIVEMLQAGSRDVGFAGADWVSELDLDVVELLDTGLDPVQLVAAAPRELILDERWSGRRLTIASEYQRLTESWIERRGLNAQFVRSYGATEVFPPDDADLIVDNTATGSTLRANGLEIVDELMLSSTRLYASPRVMDDPRRRARVEDLVLLLRSVLEARRRVMLEVNVGAANLDALVAVLPCMRKATVSPLHGNGAYAVKAAVPRDALPALIPQLKAQGATDLIVTELAQIVP
jgi:ATP phosphoribosyltransferase